MSLINQALRKAQRDRAPHRMAEPNAAGPSTPPAAAGNGMKPALVVGLVVVVALLLVLVAGLSVVLIKGDDSAPTAQKASATHEKPPAQRISSARPQGDDHTGRAHPFHR